MEKFIHQNLPLEQRVRVMEDNADFKEQKTYSRTLSENDLIIERESLATAMTERQALIEQLKSEQLRFKALMKPYDKIIGESMSKIRTRVEEKDDLLWAFKDFENSIIEYYDENGEKVHVRQMMPSERQRTTMAALRERTGTNS